MARLPRLVLSGYPCHVTQRGNRRRRTFFEEDDYSLCRDPLGEAARYAPVTAMIRTAQDLGKRVRVPGWEADHVSESRALPIISARDPG